MVDVRRFRRQPSGETLDQHWRKPGPPIIKEKSKKDKDITVAKIKTWCRKGFEKLKLPMKKHRETKLSDFHLLGCLGTGRFARVRLVLAKHRTVGTSQFALKYFSKETIASSHQADLILTESEILSRLAPHRHPFLINMLASFQDIERAYFVLDVGENGDLRKFINRGINSLLNPSLFRIWMAQVASALAFLHGMGVVHRDIKPDNFVIDGSGNLRLTDFNISVIKTETKITGRAGSLAYTAPEVIRGEAYGESIDWWSVGILFYELVHGQRPFRAKGPPSSPEYRKLVEHAILYEDALPLKLGPEWLGLGQLIKELLAKDASSRPGYRAMSTHKYFIPLIGHNHDWQRLLKGDIRSPFARIMLETERKVRFEPAGRLSQGFQVIDSRTRSLVHAKSADLKPNVYEIPPIPHISFNDIPSYPPIHKQRSLQPNELAGLFREPMSPPPA
ncbi:Serine/threonine kinase [Entomophthora muscae]|uniref:Serine/threonine kinase n=1 Tax=Entomophthora muscae TaxID=34485 RepID=A0ACC2UPM7_9FUNG|nr:Serine/threonine kinase [Entomophthora muscae]